MCLILTCMSRIFGMMARGILRCLLLPSQAQGTYFGSACSFT
ncbi:hypothetical protein NC651_009462 [Populus alba x Populus x berolinensis]|nr:hypothetical protein NC651_009462 [Populus alba x Populus x berolinensis]